MNTYLETDKTVLLASEMTDFGEVAEKGSKVEAQKLANEERVAITIRDPLTDTVLAVVQPKGRGPKGQAIKVRYSAIDGASDTRSFTTLGGARRFANEMVGAHPEMGSTYAASGDGIGKVTVDGATLADLFPEQSAASTPKAPKAKKTATKAPVKAKAKTVAKAASGDDNEIAADEAEQRRAKAVQAKAPTKAALAKAARAAKAKAIAVSKAEVAKLKAERKAAGAKAKPAPKAKASAPKATKAKAGAAKAPRAPREGGPKGMVVEILKLASRPDGVSPAELNTLTTWKGAPWKWLFSNPKGNGYCDRWGYSFEVVKTDAGVRYKVAKLAAASV